MPITVLGSLAIINGGITAAGSVTKEAELSAAGKKTVLTQTLSTSLADINIGSITWSDGTYLWVQNLSATPGEIVTIAKGGVEMGIINPGESFGPIMIKPDGTAMRAKSATGTPTIQTVMAGPLA